MVDLESIFRRPQNTWTAEEVALVVAHQKELSPMPTNPLAQAALEMAEELERKTIHLSSLVKARRIVARALLQWKLDAREDAMAHCQGCLYNRQINALVDDNYNQYQAHVTNAGHFFSDCYAQHEQCRIAELTAALKELE